MTLPRNQARGRHLRGGRTDLVWNLGRVAVGNPASVRDWTRIGWLPGEYRPEAGESNIIEGQPVRAQLARLVR